MNRFYRYLLMTAEFFIMILFYVATIGFLFRRLNKCWLIKIQECYDKCFSGLSSLEGFLAIYFIETLVIVFIFWFFLLFLFFRYQDKHLLKQGNYK